MNKSSASNQVISLPQGGGALVIAKHVVKDQTIGHQVVVFDHLPAGRRDCFRAVTKIGRIVAIARRLMI